MTNEMCHRWLNELPREVKEAAGPGCACCLFWPPADAAWRHTARGSGGLWQRVKKLPFVHYVDLAAKVSISFIPTTDKINKECSCRSVCCTVQSAVCFQARMFVKSHLA